MDIDLIIEILKNNRTLWATATVTGGFAVVISIVNAVCLFLQRKKQLEYDKKLEIYKSKLDSKNYVSKVRFDAEFLLYRELMVSCRNMINDVYFVYPIFTYVPADEEAREKYEQDVYNNATKSYNDFSTLITGNAPFIPKDFYDKFIEIVKLCRQNLNTFRDRYNVFMRSWWNGSMEKQDAESEAYKRTGDINKMFETLVDEIRDYLFSLEVND